MFVKFDKIYVAINRIVQLEALSETETLIILEDGRFSVKENIEDLHLRIIHAR